MVFECVLSSGCGMSGQCGGGGGILMAFSLLPSSSPPPFSGRCMCTEEAQAASHVMHPAL